MLRKIKVEKILKIIAKMFAIAMFITAIFITMGTRVEAKVEKNTYDVWSYVKI